MNMSRTTPLPSTPLLKIEVAGIVEHHFRRQFIRLGSTAQAAYGAGNRVYNSGICHLLCSLRHHKTIEIVNRNLH